MYRINFDMFGFSIDCECIELFLVYKVKAKK
jgi:hypothetical protein